jgi:type 1 glutamine amidotransferase
MSYTSFRTRILTAGTLAVFLLSCFSSAGQNASPPLRVLIFSRVAGYYHQTIDTAEDALVKWGAGHNWTVTKTRDTVMFTDDILMNFDVVVWNNNCASGEILPASGRAAFERYIHNGGGYAGIHGAAYSYFTPLWKFYGDSLVGAREVNTGPCHLSGLCSLKVAINDPVTAMFPPTYYPLFDEYYSLTDDITKRVFPVSADSFQVLVVAKKMDVDVTCDYRTGSHPVSWRHTFYGGRAFYTEVGHESTTFRDSVFIKHLAAGIQWAGTKQASGVANKAPSRSNITGKFLFVCGKTAHTWDASSLPVYSMTILDVRGRLVFSQSVSGPSFSWNGIGVNGVRAPKGIYCFCGKTAGADVVKTFVKQD